MGFKQISVFVYKCVQKSKSGQGTDAVVPGPNLDKAVRKDLPEEVTFEQRLE